MIRAFGLGTEAFAVWLDVGRLLVRVHHYDVRVVVPLSWGAGGVRECVFVTRRFSRGAPLDQLHMHVASGRVIAELGDVAPAGLPHVRLSGLVMAKLQRPGLGAVPERIDVSLPMVVTSSYLPLSIWFVDAKAGACARRVPLR